MIILDTDAYTHLRYGREKLLRRIEEADEFVTITIVTWIEVLKGRFDAVLKAATGAELRITHSRLQEAQIELSNLIVLPVTDETIAEFDRLRQDRTAKRAGRADLLIACHAIAEHAVLVTRNLRDFKKIPGLSVENWMD